MTYRETVRQRRPPARSREELYARVVRVGGTDPITAQLEIGRHRGTYRVATAECAKSLAIKLSEVVKIEADVSWDMETLEILELVVLKVDENWQDIHLGQIIEAHSRLPVQLSVQSTEELQGD